MNDRSLKISLMLNGAAVELDCTAPTQTLLHALGGAGYTGTKEGCGDGDCGACTVAILRKDSEGATRAIAVNSCLIPCAQMAGANILTVEGVRTVLPPRNAENADQCPTPAPKLHPVQQAMVTHAGSQCGYCTPGFVMSLFAEFHSAESAFEDVSVEGNLCRCTGYNSIRRAMAELRTEPRFVLPELPALHLQPTTPPTSAWFVRAANLKEALALKRSQPHAQWLAGATDLGLEFSRNAQHQKPLIAIEHLPELMKFQLESNTLEIGAAVTLSRLQSALLGQPASGDPDLFQFRHAALSGLYTMLHWFAARQVRNRATLGGNLGTGSPISDLPPVLLALDATLCLSNAEQDRDVAIADYFLGYRKTSLAPEELIRSVRIPLSGAGVRRYTQSYKVGKRGSDDISIVAACFCFDVDVQGKVLAARMAYGGVAATPVCAVQTEAHLLGEVFSASLAQLAAPLLAQELTPLSDFRGSEHYRRRLIVSLFEKFLFEMLSAGSGASL